MIWGSSENWKNDTRESNCKWWISGGTPVVPATANPFLCYGKTWNGWQKLSVANTIDFLIWYGYGFFLPLGYPLSNLRHKHFKSEFKWRKFFHIKCNFGNWYAISKFAIIEDMASLHYLLYIWPTLFSTSSLLYFVLLFYDINKICFTSDIKNHPLLPL